MVTKRTETQIVEVRRSSSGGVSGDWQLAMEVLHAMMQLGTLFQFRTLIPVLIILCI